MEYFQVNKLAEGVTQIKNVVRDCMYLIEGNQKAALIDTGTGCGALADLVKTLTKLPVTVFLTHGHLDHAGGIYDFDKVCVHPGDIELIKRGTSYEKRAEYVEYLDRELYQNIPKEDYCVQKEIPFWPISEGDCIDLGGRQLEVLEVPGHTTGSVCFWDKANKIVFTGDACCVRTLFFPGINSDPLTPYLKSLRKFLDFVRCGDKMYWGHYDGALTEECVWNVLDCCIDILNGEDEKVPFQFMDEKGFSAHKLLPDNLNRADGKVGNIVYSAEFCRR